MNKIKQLHLDSINSDNSHDFDVYANVEYTRDFNPNKAAVKSAEITEQIAVKFGKWVENLQKNNKEIRRKTPNIPTKDLFKEFLKTKI